MPPRRRERRRVRTHFFHRSPDPPYPIYSPPHCQSCTKTFTKYPFGEFCELKTTVDITITHNQKEFKAEWKKSNSTDTETIMNPTYEDMGVLLKHCRVLRLYYDHTKLQEDFTKLLDPSLYLRLCFIEKVIIHFNEKAPDLSKILGHFQARTEIFFATSTLDFDKDEHFNWRGVVGFQNDQPVSASTMVQLMANPKLLYLNVTMDKSCRAIEGCRWQVHDALFEWSQGRKNIKHWQVKSVFGGAMFPCMTETRSRPSETMGVERLDVITSIDCRMVTFKLLSP